MLCRYMINAGLGVPGEYFNPVFLEPFARRIGLRGEDIHWRSKGRARRWLLRRRGRDPRAEFLRSYISHLLANRTRNGVFASKIQYWHYGYVLRNPIGSELLDGSVFVHLYRRDLIDQAISYHVAKLTNRWGFTDDVIGRPLDSDPFDTKVIERHLEEIVTEDAGWRAFFVQHGITPLGIAYEDLQREPDRFVREIARLIGLSESALTLGYQETGAHPERIPGLPSKSEIRQRFLAASRAIRPADRMRAPPDALLRDQPHRTFSLSH